MFFSSDPAVSSSIFVGAEREEMIGNFSVSRSCRPFCASHASEQLSLVSASREGPKNFPFKFSGC